MRIVIGEDEVLLRDALVRMLTGAGHEVVGVAGDGPGLVRRAQTDRPELVIAVGTLASHQLIGIAQLKDAVGRVHRLEHVFDELAHGSIELGDGQGLLFERGVGPHQNFANHAYFFNR
jgi:DNA-binding NarL/FixJ family response regulator